MATFWEIAAHSVDNMLYLYFDYLLCVCGENTNAFVLTMEYALEVILTNTDIDCS